MFWLAFAWLISVTVVTLGAYRLGNRYLALREKQAERPPAPPKADPLPPLLAQWVMSAPESWAREDKRKYLDELYESLGSWDQVMMRVDLTR